MSFIERWGKLPYLEPEKQKFVALEMTSVIIITAGCATLLFTLFYETTLGGIPKEQAYRILRVLTGVFIVLIGLVILLFFLYRHITALESKLEDLKAPKEPESYKDGIAADKYVEMKQKEKEVANRPPTEEELQAQRDAEAKTLSEKMATLDKSLIKLNEGETYHKCPMCGDLFTEEWDTCPKCGAKVR
jgi:predicted RNA-binding Zn-ribbon protein involved in translation (DUF1610 family)